MKTNKTASAASTTAESEGLERDREWLMAAADCLLDTLSQRLGHSLDHATKRADGECALCSDVADDLGQLLRGTVAAPVPAEPVRVCSLCQSGHIHDQCDTVGITTPVPAGQTEARVAEFRCEVQDKLSVVFNGCNSAPLQRAINRKQCEDFLVEMFAAALAPPPSPAPEEK